MSEAESSTGSVVIYGDCPLLLAAAVVFRVYDWRVTLVAPSERHDAVRRYLEGYGGGPEVALATAVSGHDADFVVCCEAHGRPDGVGGATVIALSGVDYDDGETRWQSCADLIACMRSGLGSLTRPVDGDSLGPPFLPAGRLPSYYVALYAAFVAGASLAAPEQPREIRLTAQEAMLASLDRVIGAAQLAPAATARAAIEAGRPQTQVQRVGGKYRCRDGEIFVLLPTQTQWQPIIALLWRDEWAAEDWWKEMTAPGSHTGEVESALAAFCAARTREEAVEALQRAGVPVSPVADAADVLANPQLRARGFATDDAAGGPVFHRPYRVEIASAAEPAPSARDTQSPTPVAASGPLAGLTVCDLSWWWAGPWAAMLLSMLGATVVKVEGRARLDPHRMVRPFVPGDGPEHDRGFSHQISGRGKLSLAVNLKHPDGMQAVRDLLARSDVLVSNFQPGTLERLGLGFEAVTGLTGARPFVYAELSGFGVTGPWRDYRAFGPNLASFGALNTLTGTAATGPVEVGIPLTDPLGGTAGAAAIVTALQRSRRAGLPVRLDVSQLEVQSLCISDGLRLGRQSGNRRDGDLASTGVYRCLGEDGYVAVSLRTPEVLASLRELAGAGLESEVEAALARWAGVRTKEQAASELRRHGIDATEVLSAAELLSDPSLGAAGFWYEESGVRIEHGPWRTDSGRTARVERSPRLGEHNEYVLTQLLGYPAERARALQASGAIE